MATRSDSMGRIMAVVILLLLVLAVYFMFFHTFVQQHMTLTEDIALQEEQLLRYQQTAASKSAKQAKLRALRQAGQDDSLFLAELDFNEAAAAMANNLKQIVSSTTNTRMGNAQRCQVISNTNVRSRGKNKERFEPVNVKIRMRCMLGDFYKVLHELEGQEPLIFIDQVSIFQPRARSTRRRGKAPVVQVQALDIRFDMIGYLKG